MSALMWATTTKEAFYVLNALIIAAVAADPPTSIEGWLLVIVSEYYQGVALPGLGAAQKKTEEVNRQENEKTRKLVQETHDAVMNELAEIRAMHEEHSEELAEIKAMHEAQVDELAELKELHRDLNERYDNLVRALEMVVRGGESV